MYLVWYIAFCFALAFIMAVIFEKKFEDSIVVGKLGIIVLLYIFYVLDVLHVGVYVICMIILGGILYSCYKVLRERKIINVIELMFSPAAFIYLILLLLIYYTVRFNKVSLIDELHLWAALPKILATQQGKLQLKETMLLGFTDYIPGMPLYLYFLMRVNRAISEPLMYFGYAALGGAMLLPMCGKIKSYKRWYIFPLIAVVLYLLPLTFYNSLYNDHAIYYKSLHVDSILGITVGYATWLFSRKPWQDWYKTIQCILVLSFLTILKSSGIVFVGIILCSLVIYLFIYEKDIFKKVNLYCFSFPLMLYVAWKVCLYRYAVQNTVEYAISDIVNFKFIKEFLITLATESIMVPRNTKLMIFCTFGTLILWLVSLYIILWNIVGKQRKNSVIKKWAFITLWVEIFTFVIGIYGLCVGPFGSTLLSYGRYICTTLTALLVYWVYECANGFDTVTTCVRHMKKKWICVIALECIVIVFFYPLYQPMGISYPQSALQDADAIERIVNSYVKYDTNQLFDKAVMIVDKEYDSYSPDLHIYLQRRLYFDLIDEKIQINNQMYFSDEVVSSSQNIDDQLITVENDWSMCDYVFWIHYVDDDNKIIEVYQVTGIEGKKVKLHRLAVENVN